MATYDSPRPSSQPVGSTDPAVVKDDLITLDKIATSTDPTVTNRKGGVRKTLLGLEVDAQDAFRLGAGVPQGDYVGGVSVYEESNWTFTYNGQQWGLSGDFDLSNLPYLTTESDPNNDANLAVRGSASQEYVQTEITRGQNEVVNGTISPPDDDVLADGMTVTAGTTNLRTLVGGEPTIVAMSPLASGIVNSLSTRTATIGGEQVRLDFSRSRVIYAMQPPYSLNPRVTADNTVALRRLIDDLQDGDIVDFCGEEFRVYASVTGIASSGANPTTDNALDPSQCLLLDGLNNITFRNGTLYAANQSTASAKTYFPSTLSFINCTNITFDNFTSESKGQSWGDADASVSETKARRLEFLATNGGHAVYFGRCKGVYGNLTTRRCGSTSPCYFSSCTDVRLDKLRSNPASLGYSAVAADAWVGNLAEVGVDEFYHIIHSPIFEAETLTRREDGAATGSSIYCGKGGLLTEDVGVTLIGIGGMCKDMYGSGGGDLNVGLGYAAGAGSGSTCNWYSPVIRNCAMAAWINWTVDSPAKVAVVDMDAELGLTGIHIPERSFGTGYALLTGKAKITHYRDVSSLTDKPELQVTSLVSCLKTTSNMFVELDLNISSDSDINTLVYNVTNACYGGVTFKGGDYRTNGYLMRSVGWCPATSNSPNGIVDEGSKFHDRSLVTLPYIQYENRDSDSVLTYINHDFSKSIMKSATFRQLDGYTIQGTDLDEKIRMPYPSSKLWASRVKRRTTTLRCISIDGLSGSDALITFQVLDNAAIANNARIINGADEHRILGAGGSVIEGSVKYGMQRQYILSGDVRSSYTVGNNYVVMGA